MLTSKNKFQNPELSVFNIWGRTTTYRECWELECECDWWHRLISEREVWMKPGKDPMEDPRRRPTHCRRQWPTYQKRKGWDSRPSMGGWGPAPLHRHQRWSMRERESIDMQIITFHICIIISSFGYSILYTEAWLEYYPNDPIDYLINNWLLNIT